MVLDHHERKIVAAGPPGNPRHLGSPNNPTPSRYVRMIHGLRCVYRHRNRAGRSGDHELHYWSIDHPQKSTSHHLQAPEQHTRTRDGAKYQDGVRDMEFRRRFKVTRKRFAWPVLCCDRGCRELLSTQQCRPGTPSHQA